MRIFYLFIYFLLWIPVHIVYPMIVTGRSSVPEGPCIICANHSNYIDPFLLIYAFGPRRFLHTMSKKENIEKPFVGWIYRMCGGFPVERGGIDMNAVRTTMSLLKKGCKVVIFPEGTRTEKDDPNAGKHGAVRFASKLHVPILPVFITRNKKAFGLVRIRIGRAYEVCCRTHQEYEEKPRELMNNIFALGRANEG